MSRTPYRIKRAEHPAELEGAVRARALTWQQAYQGVLSPEVIEAETSEEAISRRTLDWAKKSQEGTWFWVLTDSRDNHVAGMALGGAAHEDDAPAMLELVQLYVADEAKGTGAAERLLEMAVGERDMECYLWVLEGNERAQAFYRRMGFEPDGASRAREDLGGVREVRMVRRPVVED